MIQNIRHIYSDLINSLINVLYVFDIVFDVVKMHLLYCEIYAFLVENIWDSS